MVLHVFLLPGDYARRLLPTVEHILERLLEQLFFRVCKGLSEVSLETQTGKL